MNRKRLLSAMLALIMVLSLLSPAASASTVPSAWAVPEMNDANTSGLLTPSASKDFHRALTREEFCELIVIMVERILGRELPIPDTNPFSDSTSVPVQKAYQYGVINGIGGGLFAPESSVERQQLCTMMVRAILNLERDTGKSLLEPAAALPFKDSGKIASYALDPVKRAYASGIMYGDNANNFNPLSNITSQECVAVVIRSFNSIQGKLAVGRTDAQIVDLAYNRLSIGYAYGDSENGVTRSILLPETGTGGCEITWRSGNESVISSDGTVIAGTTPVAVTITATITLGEASREKEFILTTSPYSGDRLIVENAINAIEVIYLNVGDGPNSVTGRICLPNTSMGLPVVWTTSNYSTISPYGVVTLPQSSDVREVTLTATVSSGSSTRSKSFELKVNNPAYTNRSVSLFGVGLGMTQSQVAQVLGSPKSSIRSSSSETWNTYHDNYKNFVAVGFVNNSSVAVYSSDANAANQLKDASQTVITVAQADGVGNVRAIAYKDQGSSNRDYAIMLYTPGSVIGSSRTLESNGQEQLLFDLINAFRVSNKQNALEWNSKLSSAARTHSADMGSNNYLSVISRSGYSLLERISSLGYDTKLASSYNVLGGNTDVIEFFDNMINTTEMRADVLTANNTVVGTGFSSGYGGQYRSYVTYIFGTLKSMTGVTSNPASPKVDAGKTLNVTLTPQPSGCNETYSVRSSNTGVMTVELATNRVTVTGVAAGTANIIVTSATNNRVFTVPVTVGSVNATDLKLKLESDDTVVSDKDGNYTVFMGTGDILKIIPETTPTAGPTVTWSIDKPAIATVSSAGVVTAKAVGSATVTARVSASSGVIERKTTIHVGTLGINMGGSIAFGSTNNITRGQTQPVTLSVTPAEKIGDSNYPSFTYEWSSSNTNVVTLTPPPPAGDTFTINTHVAGTAVITVTAKRTGATGGTITKNFTVNVTESEYATGLTLSEYGPLTLEKGQTKRITATPVPVAVENRTVLWHSSDTKIATVDQTGLITAKDVGSTIISATIATGTNSPPFTITVDVTVTEKTVALKSLLIDGPDTVKVGNKEKYSPKYSPTNTTQTAVDWDIVNSATITWTINPLGTDPNSREITFSAAGTYIIRVWLIEDPTIIAIKSVTVTQ